MSYQRERDDFISRMSREQLPMEIIRQLLAGATTLNRIAELECSSETADRDRVPCPGTRPRASDDDCCCDYDHTDNVHRDVPRVSLQGHRLEHRLRCAMPKGWALVTAGDPRGYVLRVVPPSYAERNAGRDRHNLDAIGVPNRESGIRW